MKQTITAVIITKNEEEMLLHCLQTLSWCDQILIIDDNSTDKTTDIAENFGAKVISYSNPSFAQKRQEALKRVKTDWLFYIDADERVTPQLAKEIQVNIETLTADVLSLERENMFYGKTLNHGGWQTDVLERVFRLGSLEGWFGDIHESPRFTGTVKQLHSKLIHLSHRSTVDGLLKSAAWTPLEAQALFAAGLKPVTAVTVLRKGVMEIVRRGFLKKGYKDGLTGMMEAIIQGINRMLVYIQVWELQQKPPIHQLYSKKEKEITELWQREQ